MTASVSAGRSPEYRRATSQVLRWASWYTRGIDQKVARERLDELASDLHDHVVWAEEAELSPEELTRSIRRRRLRGVIDDLSWRRAQLRGARAGDPVAYRARVENSAAVMIVFGVGLAVLAFGVGTMTRAIGYLALTGDNAVTTNLVALVASTMLAAVGLVLLGWNRGRFAASIALAVAQAGIVQFGFHALLYGSATVNSYMYFSSSWPLQKYALAAALALFFTAAALWWLPRTRSARSLDRADTMNGAQR